MECRKRYYEDCHLQRFTAEVQSCAAISGGYAVTLDATAFYPGGGGQACDTGTLGGARVREVWEAEGRILHLCDRPLEPGDTVEGQIDYDARFDRMQQHTGEHILSGILFQRFGIHNVGFHMGAETVSVDFDGTVPESALPDVLAQCNRAIWENLPVLCSYPTQEELPKIPYRAKRALPWPVRIVEIPGYDCCACCGVHVARTGEIGLLHIFSQVKLRGGVRMEIACGRKALALLCRCFDQNRLVSQAFSVPMTQTGAAADQMNALLEAEKYRSTGLEMRVFDAIAAVYAGSGDVVHFEPSLNGASLRALAQRIAARCGGIAAVFSGSDADGYGFCLMGGADLRPMEKEMAAALNGRGGGRPECQQGTLRATRAEIEGFFAARK